MLGALHDVLLLAALVTGAADGPVLEGPPATAPARKGQAAGNAAGEAPSPARPDTSKVFVVLTKAGEHLKGPEGELKKALADLGGFFVTITNDPRTTPDKARAANAGMMIHMLVTGRGWGASSTENALVVRCRFFELVRREEEDGQAGALRWRNASTRTLLGRSRVVREYVTQKGKKNTRRTRLKPRDPAEDWKIEAEQIAAQIRGTLFATFFKGSAVKGLSRHAGKVGVGVTLRNGTSRTVTGATVCAPYALSYTPPASGKGGKAAKGKSDAPPQPAEASGKAEVAPGRTVDFLVDPPAKAPPRSIAWQRGWLRKVTFQDDKAAPGDEAKPKKKNKGVD